MPAELIITVSGLRGIVGESLTPDVAARYALAFAATLPPGGLAITNDARSSAPLLEQAISQALLATGRDVWLAGPAATPTLGVLVRELGAIGGIQISASHNPAQYNGMKLFSAEGRVLSAGDGAKVLSGYRAMQKGEATNSAPTNAAPGQLRSVEDPLVGHLKLVLAAVDPARIRAAGFRVLLDSNHGAGGPLGVRLLRELKCEVVESGTQPDAAYAHPLEPTEGNLQSVAERARTQKCHVTFCQDPDADRLAIIDEAGRYLGEELTLAICADHVLRQTPGPLVVNCSSSRVTEDLAQKHGVPYHRSKVGEANVVDMMLQQRAVLGGEGNGGVIDPRVVLVRDSMVGMALVLEAMASRGLAVSALADELPRYAIVKSKVELGERSGAAAFEPLKREFAEASANDMDGLRFDWPDRWLLVRASNTEPIVRVIAEAPTAAAAQELCQRATAALRTG